MTLVTEEQAKEMWCPAVRAGDEGIADDAGQNRESSLENPPYARCIASKCMWWRWQLEPVNPDPMATVIGGPNPTKYERGFCGMAGKP